MLPYDGVIKKRLQLKGQLPIPPYAPAEIEEGEEGSLRELRPSLPPNPPDVEAEITSGRQEDTRTEAQKKRDQVMLQREKEALRKEAEKSYKERVEVSSYTYPMTAKLGLPNLIYSQFCVSRNAYCKLMFWSLHW